MKILFMWIGILSVVSALLILCAYALFWIRQTWHDRKYSALEASWKHCLGDINRWCNYEFPQIGFMANRIIEEMSRGATINAETFREELRNRYGGCGAKEPAK